jgi:hypothetical protein
MPSGVSLAASSKGAGHVVRDERLAMARRYLGPEGGDEYIASNPADAEDSLMVRMTPEHWLGVDYGKDG